MKFSQAKIFVIALLAGIVLTSATIWATRPAIRGKTIHNLDNTGVYVTDQVRASDFQQFARYHIATLVDLRPDGEALDQISSATVGAIAKKSRIGFSYIPVPHGVVPSADVDELSAVLATAKRPVLLYCRTGKRAVRTFCLADASSNGGHSAIELALIARNSGFPIDDIQGEVNQRVAARKQR